MLPLLGLIGAALFGFAMLPAHTSDSHDGDGPHGNADDPVDLALGTSLNLTEEAHANETQPDDPLAGEDLDGDDGDSVLLGTRERDVMFTGDADDVIDGQDGDDYLDGEGGDDVLIGGVGADTLHGGDGQDDLSGGADDDILCGHTGDDVMSGGSGNDTLVGGEGDDVLDGGDGDDALQGGMGADTLDGGTGVDVLMGGDGNDALHGGDDAAVDYINGGNGDDWLHGGAFDNLNGGFGADHFITVAGQASIGTVHIDDFDADEDTMVVLYDITAGLPVLSVEVGDAGLTLLANGAPLATLANVTDLDLNTVQLVAA